MVCGGASVKHQHVGAYPHTACEQFDSIHSHSFIDGASGRTGHVGETMLNQHGQRVCHVPDRRLFHVVEPVWDIAVDVDLAEDLFVAAYQNDQF